MFLKKLFSDPIKVSLLIGLITVGVIAGFSVNDLHETRKTLEEMQQTALGLEASAKNMEKKVDILEARVEAKQKKIEHLRQTITDIKSGEYLQKRDLAMYIKKKYPHVPKVLTDKIAEQAVIACKKHNAPFPIVVGIMEVESHFNPMAVSKKGARGLMQVMPKYWLKHLNLENKYKLHDVDTGIDAGVQVLLQHVKEANNDIKRGLYYYVGKDRTYANKVFAAMGEFVAYRTTVVEE